ncbi:MAG TPA: membrane trafficking protein [Clostridiaceae bacterium]|nr:membrane trafficking protein [Clostridiaceae bacterium]
MNNSFNKKLAEIFGKVDEKVLQAKLNAAIDMLKKGEIDDLVKKINKMDKDELMRKINEFDMSKFNDLNIDKDEIKQLVSKSDFDNMAKLIGDQGEEIIKKIKDIIEY